MHLKIKSHINLLVIVAAALLLELVSGVMYYTSQDIIQRTVERLVARENNAIHLCIRNKLAEVEVTLRNMTWVVAKNMSEPDSLFGLTYQLVKHNPAILGSSITCIPDLYPQKGRWFEPYSVRRPDGSIETLQLGSEAHDYTQSEFFTVPVATGGVHWCEPYMDKDGARTMVTTCSVPVRDAEGRIVAVVDADLSLDWLQQVINEHKAYRSTQRFLVTRRHHLLAGEENGTFRQFLQQFGMAKKGDGYVVMEDGDGKKCHVFYTPVGGTTDWVLVNVLDDGDVFGKLRHVRHTLLLMILAGLLLIGFIVYRTSRNLNRLRQVNAEKEQIASELRIASQIQQSMLPHSHLHSNDVDICGTLLPAREVGGDLFDYFIRDEKLFFCIGDVSGKGTPSAMLMACTHSFFRAFAAHENNPARVMQAVNEAACQGNETNMFVTLFIGVLDLPTGRLRYCDAGHDAPILLSAAPSSLPCNPHLPIGLFDDIQYQVQETSLASGSTLVLYTDGVTEAKNVERQQFGLGRLEEVLSSPESQRLRSSKEVLGIISDAVRDFVKDAEQSDDLTMLAIRYTPQPFEPVFSESLTLKNDVREVTRLSQFQHDFFEKTEIEKTISGQIRLAVEEAVVNIIDYAYPANVEGNIEIHMMTDGQRLKPSFARFDPVACATSLLRAVARKARGQHSSLPAWQGFKTIFVMSRKW